MPLRCRISALTMAQHCPGYPALAASIPRVETEATRAGTARHAAIAGYLASMLPCSDSATVDAALAMSGGLVADIESEVDALGDGRVVGHPDVELAEIGGNADISGFIDWKTGREASSPPVGDDLQLDGYALGVARKHEVTRVRAYRVHLDAGVVLLRAYETSDLGAARERLETVLASGDELRVGAHCDRCLLRSSCPALRAHADEVREALIALDEPAVAIVDDAAAVRFRLALPRLEKLMDEGKAALRSYLEQHDGRAIANGTEIYLSRSARQTISAPLHEVAAVVGEVAAAAQAKVTSVKGWSDDELTALRTAGLLRSHDVVQVRSRKMKP